MKRLGGEGRVLTGILRPSGYVVTQERLLVQIPMASASIC